MVKSDPTSTPAPAWKDSTLLLLGHGSTTNRESSQPTRRHAGTIRRQGVFADVLTAFWKEKPYFSEVLGMIRSEFVYVVPNFISEGYYTREIIPREMAMTGRVTRSEGKVLFYCDPVGGHESMTDALLRQVEEVLAPAQKCCAEVDLILVGHGTLKNGKSTEAIQCQVGHLLSRHLFRECVAAYLEESPFIGDWEKLTTSDQVVVVPFFISEGLHSHEDIPRLMGLMKSPEGDFPEAPALVRGKKLWYARAIGNQSEMVSVILDRVRKFDPAAPF